MKKKKKKGVVTVAQTLISCATGYIIVSAVDVEWE